MVTWKETIAMFKTSKITCPSWRFTVCPIQIFVGQKKVWFERRYFDGVLPEVHFFSQKLVDNKVAADMQRERYVQFEKCLVQKIPHVFFCVCAFNFSVSCMRKVTRLRAGD